MPVPGSILDYRGAVDQKKIDSLLAALRQSRQFKELGKTSGMRLYSVVVECLDNILRHSVKKPVFGTAWRPFINVSSSNGNIIIRTGNAVATENTTTIISNIERINSLNISDLKVLYEQLLNNEIAPGANTAGLGFLVMRIKSFNPVNYGFTRIDRDHSFFEINIKLKRYQMRKLIIDRTASSPKVHFDPDERIFEISGESRPHDVGGFYGEILDWFSDFSSRAGQEGTGSEKVVFSFDLEYFNSSSAKYILDFCKKLAKAKADGRNIEVRWQYEKDDADMLEAGREMSRIARCSFEFVSKDND